MMDFEPDLGAQRIPVTILLGARGSGKTSLLNRIVRDSSRGPWGVILNEEGGTAASGDWRESIRGQMVPHAVGCLCCVGRSSLVDALRRFYALRSRESDPVSGRVVIETADNADPAPVMQTLLNNALVTQFFRLGTVVAVVQADDAGRDLAERTHLFKQVAVADRIAITGTDRVDAQTLVALRSRLSRLNPAADIRVGEADPQWKDGGYHDVLSRGGSPADWLAFDTYAAPGILEGELHAFAIRLEQQLEWPVFESWLEAGLKLNADVIYRVRGILDVAEAPGPVIVQGVQHVFQPPVHLQAWRDGERVSRLTFVTREIDRESVLESLARDLPRFAERVRDRRIRYERSRTDPSLPI